MSGAIKLSICPGCNQIRIRSEYHTNPATNNVYPRCRYCGNPAKRKVAERVCITCGVSKPIRTGFTEPRTKRRAYSEYSLDCKECRKKGNVTRAQMSESQIARQAKRKASEPAQKPTPLPKLTGNAWFDLGASERPAW